MESWGCFVNDNLGNQNEPNTTIQIISFIGQIQCMFLLFESRQSSKIISIVSMQLDPSFPLHCRSATQGSYFSFSDPINVALVHVAFLYIIEPSSSFFCKPSDPHGTPSYWGRWVLRRKGLIMNDGTVTIIITIWRWWSGSTAPDWWLWICSVSRDELGEGGSPLLLSSSIMDDHYGYGDNHDHYDTIIMVTSSWEIWGNYL